MKKNWIHKKLANFIILMVFSIILIVSCEKQLDNPTSDYWVKHSTDADSILQRYGAVGFSIGNKGYFGMGNDYDYFDDFWEFDTISNTWKQLATFSGNRRMHSVAFTDDKYAYVGLGYSYRFVEIDSSVFVKDTIFYSDFWRFNPQNNAWEQTATFAGMPRGQAVAFTLNNTGYIGTGIDTMGVPLSDFWKYNSTDDTWQQVANFGGESRFDAVGFAMNNMGYVAAGASTEKELFNDLWQYSPTTNTWLRKAYMPDLGRQGAVAFVLDSLAFVGTGWREGNLLNDMWAYNPYKNTWTEKNPFMGNARMHAVAFSIGKKGFVMGGFQNPDLWEYVK